MTRLQVDVVAIIISALALAVSAFALWKTQLAPARVKTTPGVLRLRVYPFNREGAHWVVPAMHLTLAFANDGARAATVEAVRVLVSYPELDRGYNYESFTPVYVLPQPIGLKGTTEEDREMEFDEGSEWMPALLPPRETIVRHLVLQAGAWDAPRAREGVRDS